MERWWKESRVNIPSFGCVMSPGVKGSTCRLLVQSSKASQLAHSWLYWRSAVGAAWNEAQVRTIGLMSAEHMTLCRIKSKQCTRFWPRISTLKFIICFNNDILTAMPDQSFVFQICYVRVEMLWKKDSIETFLRDVSETDRVICFCDYSRHNAVGDTHLGTQEQFHSALLLDLHGLHPSFWFPLDKTKYYWLNWAKLESSS